MLSTARNFVYWEIVAHSHLSDAEWNMRQFRRNENEFDSNFPHTSTFPFIWVPFLFFISFLHWFSGKLPMKMYSENRIISSRSSSSSHNSQKSANIERRMEIHLIFQSAARSRLDCSLDKDCLLHFSRVLTPPRHFIVLCFSPSQRKAFKAREEDCWASLCRRRGKNHYWLITARTHNVSQRRWTGRRAAKMKSFQFSLFIFQPKPGFLSVLWTTLATWRHEEIISHPLAHALNLTMWWWWYWVSKFCIQFTPFLDLLRFCLSLLFLSALFSSTQPWWGEAIGRHIEEFRS